VDSQRRDTFVRFGYRSAAVVCHSPTTLDPAESTGFLHRAGVPRSSPLCPSLCIGTAQARRSSPYARSGKRESARTSQIPFQSAAALQAPPRVNVGQFVGTAAVAAANSVRLRSQWCRVHRPGFAALAPAVQQLLHRGLTLQSSGHTTAGGVGTLRQRRARRCVPLTSNVRPQWPPRFAKPDAGGTMQEACGSVGMLYRRSPGSLRLKETK